MIPRRSLGAPRRAFLSAPAVALVIALTLTLLLPRASEASTTVPASQDAGIGERIVEVAMRSLGALEGECFPWVRRVIAEATGRPMGFGYHDGYLEGGAVEVSLQSVRAGDVVQIADPNDNKPGADYPGLHTVIVLEQLGNGKLRAIDSNSQWDGIVRIRDEYDPQEAANRYTNLAVRAYRFGDAAPTGVGAASLQPGTSARVSTDSGGCLNLRADPHLGGQIIRCIANGSTVTVLDGSVQADGHTWQLIQAGSDIGWVAANFLAPLGSSAPSSPPSAPDPPPAPPSGSGQFVSGDLPAGGGLALVLWGGGSVDALRDAAGASGCSLLSVWTTVDGGMVGYIAGAPGFVNQRWGDRYPGDLPERLPLLVVCAGPSSTQPSTSTPPPSAPAPPPSSTVPQSDLPPGPAGND